MRPRSASCSRKRVRLGLGLGCATTSGAPARESRWCLTLERVKRGYVIAIFVAAMAVAMTPACARVDKEPVAEGPSGSVRLIDGWWAFASDTRAPQTTIDSGPSGPTNDATPTFEFSSDEPGSSFECRVDGGPWAACTSPKTTSPRADGSHIFRARATDSAGNRDATPATRTFTVDTAPPDTEIDFGPVDGAVLTDSNQNFSFSSAAADLERFECRLYAANATEQPAFESCASPKAYQNIGDGKRSFEVRAVDHAGNADPSPAKRTFVIDTLSLIHI